MSLEVLLQILAYVGSVAFYGGRLLGRVQSVEKAITKIEVRLDELVGGTTGPITIVAAATSTNSSQRRGTQAESPKAKAS